MSHSCSSWGCSAQPCEEVREQTPLAEPQLLQEGSKPQRFNFRMLPGELRLRVLRSTHLGPPESAHYKAYFDKITVRDGRLMIENFNPVYEASDPWYV